MLSRFEDMPAAAAGMQAAFAAPTLAAPEATQALPPAVGHGPSHDNAAATDADGAAAAAPMDDDAMQLVVPPLAVAAPAAEAAPGVVLAAAGNLDYYARLSLESSFNRQDELRAHLPYLPILAPIAAQPGARITAHHHRRILVNWMFQVGYRWRIRPQAMHLSVAILDLVLGREPIVVRELQCAGSAAMLLAK
jgi:hypothetical protein